LKIIFNYTLKVRVVAARVAHNLVEYDKQYLNLGATPRHIRDIIKMIDIGRLK